MLITGALCFASIGSRAYSFAPVNFFRTDDPSWRLASVEGSKFSCGVRVEGGGRTTGRGDDGTRKNILALWSDAEFISPIRMNSQDAMLDYKTSNGPIFNTDRLNAADLISTDPRGSIGRTVSKGRFAGFDVTLFGRYEIPWKSKLGTFYLHTLLPVKNRRIDSIVTKNQTPSTFAPVPAAYVDEINQLFPNLPRVINDVAGLNIASVNTCGIGDMHVLLEWEKRFREDAVCFKNINVFGKVGVAFPTSEKRHESQAYSMPLGYDGAWAIPYGIGVTINAVKHVRVGASADFVNQLEDVRVRRLKVDVRPGLGAAAVGDFGVYQQQQQFFIPNTGRATKRHGFTWQVNPYLELYRCCGRVSIRAGYQYVAHERDHLITRDSRFDNNIINRAGNLQAWHCHNVILQTTIDLVREAHVDAAPGAPQINLFAKIPCGGKNIIDPITVGGQIVFNF